MVLTIESVDKTSLFTRKSLIVQDEMNARNTCTFQLIDPAGSYRPEPGQEVDISKDGTTIFGGTIEDIEEISPRGSVALSYVVTCVDYNQIADRFRVAEVYESDPMGDIAKDIVDNTINAVSPGESITYANTEDGPTITKAVFSYLTASSCFDELSRISGYTWYIDYDKDLHFHQRETNTAPYELDDAGTNHEDFKVRKTRVNYYNKLFLRGGKEITDTQTERWFGDQETQTFVTKFPLAEVPSSVKEYTFSANDTAEAGTTTTNITMTGHGLVTGDLIINVTRGSVSREVTKVDNDNVTVTAIASQTTGDSIQKYTGSSKTIGIRAIDTGKDWYWNKESNEITQDITGTKLLTTQILEAQYKGLFQIIIEDEQTSAIAERKSVEGGTGIYENVEVDASIDTSSLGEEKTNALLRKHGSIPERIIFTTTKDGFRSGQLVTATITKHNISGTYLIENVILKDFGASDETLQYQVTAASGESFGGWIKFYQMLLEKTQEFVIRDNEVLVKLRSISDTMNMTDALVVSAAAPESRIGYMQIGFGEIG